MTPVLWTVCNEELSNFLNTELLFDSQSWLPNLVWMCCCAAGTCRSTQLWAPEGAFITSGTRLWLEVQRPFSSWMRMCARRSRSQICSDSRRSTENQTVLSSWGQRWDFVIHTRDLLDPHRFCLCRSVAVAQVTGPILSFQSNRKQSMNYGCIVENEETHEVTNPQWKTHRLGAYFSSQSWALERLFFFF